MTEGAEPATIAGSAAAEAPGSTVASAALALVQQPQRLKARLKEVPAEPGCYLLRDGEDRILYIGKAKQLRQRVRS